MGVYNQPLSLYRASKRSHEKDLCSSPAKGLEPLQMDKALHRRELAQYFQGLLRLSMNFSIYENLEVPPTSPPPPPQKKEEKKRNKQKEHHTVGVMSVRKILPFEKQQKSRGDERPTVPAPSWPWVKSQIVPPVNIPIQPLKQVLKWVVHRFFKTQNGIPSVLTTAATCTDPCRKMTFLVEKGLFELLC